MTLHAGDTLPNCWAHSNNPTLTLMTFCVVFLASLLSLSREGWTTKALPHCQIKL